MGQSFFPNPACQLIRPTEQRQCNLINIHEPSRSWTHTHIPNPFYTNDAISSFFSVSLTSPVKIRRKKTRVQFGFRSVENITVVKSVLASTVLYSALRSSQDVPHVPLTVQSWTLTVGDRRKAFTSKHVFLMRSHWNFSRWLQGRATTGPSLSIYRLQREVCWRLRLRNDF